MWWCLLRRVRSIACCIPTNPKQSLFATRISPASFIPSHTHTQSHSNIHNVREASQSKGSYDVHILYISTRTVNLCVGVGAKKKIDKWVFLIYSRRGVGVVDAPCLRHLSGPLCDVASALAHILSSAHRILKQI